MSKAEGVSYQLLPTSCFMLVWTLRFPSRCNSLHVCFVLNCLIVTVLLHWILSPFVPLVFCKDTPVCWKCSINKLDMKTISPTIEEQNIWDRLQRDGSAQRVSPDKGHNVCSFLFNTGFIARSKLSKLQWLYISWLNCPFHSILFVSKSHENTKTNNVWVHLSVLFHFHSLPLASSPLFKVKKQIFKSGSDTPSLIFKKGSVISKNSWAL